MDLLILHPTETSQWHALLNEAQVNSQCFLDEKVESYLVFLLMRFSQSPQLASSVLALDFMKTSQTNGKVKRELLQQVGDKSLLFSGLYPGLAEKKRVSVDYFIDIGKSAYLSVAEIDACDLFHALASNFKPMRKILSLMQP
jgi:hypothetical protein